MGCGRGWSAGLAELYQLIQRKIFWRASARVAKIRPWRHSRFNDAQNDSVTELSQHYPALDIDCTILCFVHSPVNACDVY